MWLLVGLCILIAVVIWVLSNLVSTKGEEKSPAATGSRRPPASRPRSSASDIERFLEEINRRRRSGPEATPPRAVKESPPVPRPARAAAPAAVPAAVAAPAPKRKSPSRPRPSVVESSPETPRKKPETVEQVVIVEEGPAPPPPALTPVVTRNVRPVSPALNAVLFLLTSREQLRSALLLHDILGEPRCRRSFGQLPPPPPE